MYRKLKPDEIIYNFDLEDINFSYDNIFFPEYEEVYKKIKISTDIYGDGYNVYLIDDFSNEKLDNLINFIDKIYSTRQKPKDLCYVIYDDEMSPVPLFLKNGYGNKLEDDMVTVKQRYLDSTYDFYNSITSVEKEDSLNILEKNRNELVNELINYAKQYNFQIKTGQNGFTFIPLKENRIMTEEEYESLEEYEKEEILDKLDELKDKTKDILEKLRKIEATEIDKLRVLLKEELTVSMKETKEEIKFRFKDNSKVIDYLEFVFNDIETNLIDNYSSIYDDDEEQIKEIIGKFKINVVLDNSDKSHPKVIYEEDPSVSNLIGNIEVEGSNGLYTSDINMIKVGSLVKANEGCLIIRLNNLLNYKSSYYYLKKALLNKKVDLNYNKGYLEFLAPINLKPKDIEINEKVILIGDYNSYELLSRYDEDFKNIFKIKCESNNLIEINNKTKNLLLKNIVELCKNNNIKTLTNDAVKEIAKYLARKAEDRKKVIFDIGEIQRILYLANQVAIENDKSFIDLDDIVTVAYPTEIIQKEIYDLYKEKKLLLNIEGKKVGRINGLSIIDTGSGRFGRPFTLTCNCHKGNGNIIDVQKESNLSGNIHDKAIGILTGFINNFIGGYDKIDVDFHLSFEQIYGKVDGDSASVAEVISMISALSKVPINQNIAVTGSINQFGDVQPIGGVNDKIEGFYKVCKLIDNTKDKGVLIPSSNMNDLILSNEIEKEIQEGNFNIYTMDNIDDAIEILLGSVYARGDKIKEEINKELIKYSDKKRKK